jgi:hypothetical protein
MTDTEFHITSPEERLVVDQALEASALMPGVDRAAIHQLQELRKEYEAANEFPIVVSPLVVPVVRGALVDLKVVMNDLYKGMKRKGEEYEAYRTQKVIVQMLIDRMNVLDENLHPERRSKRSPGPQHGNPQF